MAARFAPLFAAAIACLATPALAQDDVPPLDPQSEAVAAPDPQSAAPDSSSGEIDADVGEPTAERTILPRVRTAVASYSPAERVAWLGQCRSSYRIPITPDPNGMPDLCESYLLQYESRFAQNVQNGFSPTGANPAGATDSPSGRAGGEPAPSGN